MTTQEFITLHGANGYYTDGPFIVFADGSWIQNGSLMHTCEDPLEMARAGVKCWKIKLAVALELFDTAKKRMLAKGVDMTVPDPSEAEMNHLQALKDAVINAKAKLAEAEKKRQAIDPFAPRTTAIEPVAEGPDSPRAQREALMSKIAAIEV